MADHGLTLELWWDSTWHTVPVLTRNGCNIMRGTKKVGNDAEPATASITIDNTSGLYSPRSVVSSLYGKIGQNTKARITVDGDVRITGEVASWRPQRPVKGPGYTDIDIAGVLQRIGRGTDPLHSPIYRSTVGAVPVAYWPMEEGSGSTSLSSGLSGGVPISFTGTVNFANDARLLGSSPNPTVGTDTHIFANVTHTFASHWQVDWFTHVSAEMVSDTVMMRIWTTGGVAYWDFIMGNNTQKVVGYDAAGTALTTAGPFSTPDYLVSGWTHLRLCCKDNGGGVIEYLFNEFPVPIAVGGTFGSTLSAAFGNVYAVEILASANLDGVAYGHIAVYDAYDFSAVDQSGGGYLGERAGNRFSRLCTEEGITATVVGTASDSNPMGPQHDGTLLDLFDELARTDDASIFETKGDVGLTFRTGVSKLNQTPDITISYLGQIQPPLLPVFGDEGIRNDVTAQSPGGASGRAEQTTGPHNVQLPEDDPQGVGRYKTTIDINHLTDATLFNFAGWRVNLGTFDGTWYAAVTADLDAASSLISAVNALDIGDVIALANLPVDEALDTVECLIIGIKDNVPAKRRLVTFYCVPAEPYRVGKLALTTGDTDLLVGHLDPDGSTTTTGSVLAGAASFSVTTASGPLWTTVADDFPQDVIVGGQRVSISAISGASSPQTFTVKSAVSGGLQVRYPIAAGAAVTDQQPTILYF